MNIFLKKVRIKTLFSRFEPIKVEPLELCYLKTVADEMGHNSYIIDELFCRGWVPPKPDVIILTGYNVAENEILKEAKEYKLKYPNTKIIVGGVHIQLNSEIFHNRYIDYVVHSQSLEAFRDVLKAIQGKDIAPNGFDLRVEDSWAIGKRRNITELEHISPNRDFFEIYKDKIYYLDKREVALIKGSVGCPFKCSYCYCREINGGNYIGANYKNLVEEISSIDSKYFWIVDDIFLRNREDAVSFINEVKKAGVNKKFIVYLRADFIIKQEDMISELKQAGLDEIIIGFEAVTEKELKLYNKGTNVIDYPQVIRILKDNKIDYTALFMVQPDYGIKDFLNLYNFIKGNYIEIFTLSIFTPIKGTATYEEKQLTKLDTKYFDFLHLVTKSKLPKFIFYPLFYGMHLRLLKSERIRHYLLRRTS